VHVEIHDTDSTAAQYLIQEGDTRDVEILEAISIFKEIEAEVVTRAELSAEQVILNGIVIDADLAYKAVIKAEIETEQDIVTEILFKRNVVIEGTTPTEGDVVLNSENAQEETANEIVIERDISLEIHGEKPPEAESEEEIRPEIVSEQEIAPKVVIINEILSQSYTEEDITQGQLPISRSCEKIYAASFNDEDAISFSSFGSDKKSSNESIHTIAQDLENVSKYKFEVFEPQTPGRTVSSIFIVMYFLLGLTILTLIILTIVFDYGMLLLLVMIVIIFCSIVILTNCCAMFYTV